MVLEQVCADMEDEGYEVQSLIIPAVAVNAPHDETESGLLLTVTCSETEQDLEAFKRRIWRSTEWDDNARSCHAVKQWSQDWREVAIATCNDSVDARFSAWLAGLKNDVYDTMMGYGTPSYTRTTKNLSYLQKTIQSKEVQRQIGGLYQVGETPVLLEILRQYLFRVEQCQKLPSQMAQDEHRRKYAVSVARRNQTERKSVSII